MKTMQRSLLAGATLVALAGCQTPPTTMIFLMPGGAAGYEAVRTAPASGGQGAVAPQASGSIKTASADEETIAVSATVAVSGSGFTGGYGLQALTAYSAADVDHVVLTLLKSSDGGATYAAIGGGVTKTITQAQLGNAVTLYNLRLATDYKVVAQAYADAAETQAIDNIAQLGNDGQCSTTFTTPAKTVVAGVETVPDADPVTIPLKLADRSYNGEASSGSGLTTTNGTIVNDTTTTESF